MKYLQPILTRSLRNKIIFLTCSISFCTALFIGGFNYLRIINITLDTAIEGLAGETRLMSLRFKSAYDAMENDAFAISQIPPVQGIIHSTAYGDVEPLDGSTTELWRQRLEIAFASIMGSRPHYTQMRYIGVADNGRELVRVNRTETGLKAVPYEDLQEKGNEPYFQKALQLKKNDIYFSEVTYNREHGQVNLAFIPTVRAVLPVYSMRQELFGMIVINADYSKLLRQTFKDIAPHKNMFITNHAGDYMEFRRDGTLSDLVFHKQSTSPAPSFIAKIRNATTDETAFIEQNEITYFVRLSIDPGNPDAFLGVALRVPRDELLQEAYVTHRDTLMLAGVLILVSLVVTTWITRRLTDPLRKMTTTISEVTDYSRPLDLPVQLKDEIGDLARAFAQMTEQLRVKFQQEAEIRQQLVKVSRQAGMSEVATGVLHNVGNVLNSVNTAASLALEQVSQSHVGDLSKAVEVIDAHSDDLGTFITTDPKGQHLPPFLRLLAQHLLDAHETLLEHLQTINDKVEHIKEIIALQQSYATTAGTVEPLDLTTLMDDALKAIGDSFSQYEVEVVRDYAALPLILTDRHKVLQILVNLVSNAKHALLAADSAPKQLTVRVGENDANQAILEVVDNGVGIDPADLTKIFQHGFTTKADGHGFGLHSSALAAQEIGGRLSVHSEGRGRGAVFQLALPMQEAMTCEARY